jgi:pantoate--beta-alanine ligase
MILFKRSQDIIGYIDNERKKGNRIGFVPTMGALHEGHLSLIRNARKDNDLVAVSIFVNPTQFNDPADFQKYPVTIEKDLAMLELAGCDLVFLPGIKEIYPEGTEKRKHYDLGNLENILEGKFRPGHFQGVCMVVEPLLQIIKPDTLYLGQKDYQQCMIIRKLIMLMGMEKQIHLNISPTLREKNGLAMSSRNMRLTEDEKEQASAISLALARIKSNIRQEELALLKEQATQMLIKTGFRIDYVEIADATDLSVIQQWDGKQKLVALAAVFLNDVRLIDNMLLN